MNQSPSRTTRPQRVDAARNREAILEAAQRVLVRRPEAGLGEVARASGLTRTTVYAHYTNREELIEALVERGITATVAALDAIPAGGSAEYALRCSIHSSWEQISRLAPLLEAATQVLGERAADLHRPIAERVRSLIRRGRRDGGFRKDLPESWLVTTYFALVHAAGREVLQGTMTPGKAESALTETLLSAFRAPE